MADRIVVMHDGRIEQIGEPLALYDHPANLFVAQFIGSPAMNVVSGTIRRDDGAAAVDMGDGVRWPLHQSPGQEGQSVAYGVRPGDLEITSESAPGAVVGEVIVVEPTGAETEILVQAGQAQLTVVAHGRPPVSPGDRVGLAVTPGKVHVFDRSTGARLAA
jgi:multiple sugar transport system ATP-binding protein